MGADPGRARWPGLILGHRQSEAGLLNSDYKCVLNYLSPDEQESLRPKQEKVFKREGLLSELDISTERF